jgi:hypothetical protein
MRQPQIKFIFTLCAALALTQIESAGAEQFSDWSPPVSLGPIINTEFDDSGTFISRDGLSLYFTSNRPGGFGGLDIYVSKRATICDPWGPPENLGPTVNSATNDQTAAISPDGRRLYFASDRPGGFGGLDIYVSTRKNKRDDFAWGPPENLGSAVNTTQPEFVGSLLREKRPRRGVLYFARGAVGERDLYLTRRNPYGSFETAVPIEELNGLFDDARPAVRRDGLEMFFDSNRPGTEGALDIWVTTRAKTSHPWSAPLNVTSLNSAALDARPSLSYDGTTIYFHSGRPGVLGSFDIHVSTRTLLDDDDHDDGDDEEDDD